ncbi:MAG: FtsX-like permease family protein [Bacteroidales bacterium]|nr:FtsX-like permease family protein [Bacteroidales bacterium]
MIKHYFVSSIRLLMKNKTMFFINLIGLSIGFACTFIILSYLIDQTSYDKFHKKKDRTYRVLNHYKKYKTNGPNTPNILGTQLSNNFPEVEAVTQLLYPYDAHIKVNNEFVRVSQPMFTSNSFFDVFTTNTLYGNTNNCLTNMNSIVLTKSMYEKYFNGENPIGNLIDIQIDDEIYSFQINAIVDDFPKESSITFDMLLSNDFIIKHLSRRSYFSAIRSDWRMNYFETYFTLNESNRIDLFTQNWNKSEENESFPKEERHFYFQPLLDIHFNSKGLMNDPERGNTTYLFLFLGIGILILFIVSINYIILSMASSESRLKEIGLKKTIGSHTKSIRRQQFIESFFTSFIAFIIALLLIKLSINKINMLFSTQIEIDLFGNWMQLGTFLIVTIIISIISSGYISFFLARKSPIKLLNGNANLGKGKNLFQYSLTVFQIIIFTVLIAGTFSIYSQISFLKKKDPGFETENRLHVTDLDGKLTASQLMNLKFNLLESPEITDVVSGFRLPPTDWKGISSIPVKDDPETRIILDLIHTDGNYLKLMDIKLVEGRYLDNRLASDSQSCIINLKAAQLLNYQNPLEEKINDHKIVGVVEDFYSFSLLHNKNPLHIRLHKPRNSNHFILKTTKNGEAKAKEFATNTWNEYFPDHQFEILEVQDKISSSFYKEDNINRIILFFCIISILLAAIGLYGQSLFSISKKKKEIGIRKVNGATSYKIVLLFLRKYGILTLLANIISWPIVLYFLDKWQSNFVYKEDLSLKTLLLSFVLSMLIVLLTVLKNTLKSANSNPVEALKYE